MKRHFVKAVHAILVALICIGNLCALESSDGNHNAPSANQNENQSANQNENLDSNHTQDSQTNDANLNSDSQDLSSKSNESLYESATDSSADSQDSPQNPQNTYKYYANLFEHEGTYFLLYHSFTPVWGVNSRTEIKFQISAKIPIWRDMFGGKGSLFFGYTQTMWFQFFNFRYSSPVRDTDYKPSVFYSYPAKWDFWGGTLQELRIGFLHYSNGIGGEECKVESWDKPSPANCRSRSAANRLILEAIWESDFGKEGEAGHFGIHLSAWPYIPSRGDNLDLQKYMGYANIKLYYKHSAHLAEVHFAPIIVAYRAYYPSVRVGYSFGVSDFVAIYAQYFYGYGDNLYEYNRKSHRLGIGIRLRSF